ncbi:CAP domain-containing protein [Halorientalis pallida]|uniref:CAP domain-containing protein n=1 Tax=Halorientalis pallida TaxID=2479928 RepID=A0A498KZR2_9EURY|nr:CAP domain-containing protein [Halorientalis pallida]RXK48686.1 CAP domain-containing protein [Halorientalis pallida]
MARTLLLVLGMVVLVSIGVGVLVGIQVGNGTDSPPQSQTVTTSPTGESTPTPVPGPSQTQNETTQIAQPNSPNHQLQAAILSSINDYRIRHNRSPLVDTGPHTNRLKKMATKHSQHMAAVGVAKTSLRGSTGPERYSDAGLDNMCPFPSNSGYSTIDPSVGKLELVAKPVEAPPYENVEGGYNGDVSTVANNALSVWVESNQDRRKLLYKNAKQAGIGFVVTDRGSVYVTVALCGS